MRVMSCVAPARPPEAQKGTPEQREGEPNGRGKGGRIAAEQTKAKHKQHRRGRAHEAPRATPTKHKRAARRGALSGQALLCCVQDQRIYVDSEIFCGGGDVLVLQGFLDCEYAVCGSE